MSDSESSAEDRQLPASQRRIDEARSRGQLARSRELVHLAALLFLLLLLTALGPWLGQAAIDFLASGLRFDRLAAMEPARMAPRLGSIAGHGLLLLVPIAFALALLLAAMSTAVGGWNFSTEALAPQLSRLDPMQGFGRIFAKHAMLDHARLVLVTTALLGAAYWWLREHGSEVDALARMPLAPALQAGFEWLTAGLSLLAVVSLASAAADVPLQIFKLRADLRMTLEEVKKENKESDGDPHMKGERRRRARELSRGRMLADVPKAQVVVTNPTHYAVALVYEEGQTGAPRIVALGTDLLALKIREVAKAARVPVLESPPLARALWRHGEVGQEVPVALYTAVAQVLAWVWKLRTAAHLPQVPAIEVPPGLDPHEVPA